MKARIVAIIATVTVYSLGIGATPITPKSPIVRITEMRPFNQPIDQTTKTIEKAAPTLNPNVLKTVVTALQCAQNQKILHNQILAIIDYSLPSSQKRLWIIDLEKKKLLYNTYVSHGFNSGTTAPSFFSNKNDSKASSIGIYDTENAYNGRHGESIKLQGLDKNFNDNAYKRFIVMHGSWYVEEPFIKKYGRAGRSWGCPSVALSLVQPITEIMKDNAFLVVYYPQDAWLKNSKFLTCEGSPSLNIKGRELVESADVREPVIFVDANGNNKLDDKEPILAITAEAYKREFKTDVPLNRMLRRQVNKTEYVALTDSEFKKIDSDHVIAEIQYFIPVVKMQDGFFATEMVSIDYGKAQRTDLTSKNPIIYFEKNHSVILKSTGQFIRWLGL